MIRDYYNSANDRDVRGGEIGSLFNLTTRAWLPDLLWDYWSEGKGKVHEEALGSMLWRIAENTCAQDGRIVDSPYHCFFAHGQPKKDEPDRVKQAGHSVEGS